MGAVPPPAASHHPTGKGCSAAMSRRSPADPGDRYYSTSRQRLITVPYSHTFTASAKGRWVGKPLLNVFSAEFACVRPTQQQGGADEDAEDTESLVSTDKRRNVILYVDELCRGQLWLQGREEECRCAGEQYKQALQLLVAKDSPPCARDVPAEEADAFNVSWINSASPVLQQLSYEDLLSQLPSGLLVLQQKDTVHHWVLRSEGSIELSGPIEVMRVDADPVGVSQRRLLVVNKPSGLPVHPSGKFRKNTVNSIMEDIFGGADAWRYEAYEAAAATLDDTPKPRCSCSRLAVTCATSGTTGGAVPALALACIHSPVVSIRHKVGGFEIIRLLPSVGERGRAWLLGALRGAAPELEGANSSNPGAEGAKRPRDSSARVAQQAADAPPLEGARRVDHIPLRLLVVHRLDVPTSGVLLFALDAGTSKQVAALLMHKAQADGGDEDRGNPAVSPEPAAGCRKVYLARVHGEFRAEAVALRQHHCSLIAPTNNCMTAEPRAPAFTVAATEQLCQPPDCLCDPSAWGPRLGIDRPIYCKSFFDSTYACPSAEETDEWLRTVPVTGLAPAGDRCSTSSAPSCPGVCLDHAPSSSVCTDKAMLRVTRTGKRVEEVLEKRARLREMARKERVAVPSTAVGADEAPLRRAQLNAALKQAVTHAQLVAYDVQTHTSLLACTLLTGRTHQVRVHLSSIGYPIVGDSKYIAQLRERSGTDRDCPIAGAPVEQGAEPVGNADMSDAGAIHLHAWRYEMQFGTEVGEREVFVASPPGWVGSALCACPMVSAPIV